MALEPLTEDLTDDELAALALAADPDVPIDKDAPSFWELTADEPAGTRRLPNWYMPAPMPGGPPVRGWRRRVILLVIASFVAITVAGLCNTYGQLHFFR